MKRGQINLQAIQGLVITLVILGIVIGLGLLVLTEVQSEINETEAPDGADCAWSNTTCDSYDGISGSIDAINEIPGWLSIIVIIVIVVIILGLVVFGLARGLGRF